MTDKIIANIEFKSNVWIMKDNPAYTPEQATQTIHLAKQHIPGDLMIEFFEKEYPNMNPRATTLMKRMTDTQRIEYGCYRFFYYHGQQGTAFEPS